MIKYSCRNKASGQITNVWFSDYGDETYYEVGFGKPLRWERFPSLEDIDSALDSREYQDIGGQSGIEYLLPAEFDIEQEDITAQLEEDARVEEGIKRQNLGAAVIAKVYSINDSKNISAQVFAAMMADQTLAVIERLLKNGSLKTAKQLIQGLDNTYFTNDEKAAILAMLAQY